MVKPFECGTCSKCCYDLKIYLTLADVDRMARFLGIDPGECMEKYVAPTPPSTEISEFTFRKSEDGRCFHLDDGDNCGIHPGKPWVCRAYHCSQDPGFEKGDVGIEWGAVYNNVEGRTDLLLALHARTVTSTYIKRNGSNYNPTDYTICMSDLDALIAGTEDDRFKVAKEKDANTVVMTYNCNKCTNREGCCDHAAATLDDIRVTAQSMGRTTAEFWSEHVSSEPSPLDANMLTFRQADHGKCEFLETATHRCGLGESQPRNCAFTPCPKLCDATTHEQFFVGSGSVYDQYRVQVATSVTRQYISQCGAKFNQRFYDQCIEMIDDLASKPDYYRDFLEAVRDHRYVNEEDEIESAETAASQR